MNALQAVQAVRQALPTDDPFPIKPNGRRDLPAA